MAKHGKRSSKTGKKSTFPLLDTIGKSKKKITTAKKSSARVFDSDSSSSSDSTFDLLTGREVDEAKWDDDWSDVSSSSVDEKTDKSLSDTQLEQSFKTFVTDHLEKHVAPMHHLYNILGNMDRDRIKTALSSYWMEEGNEDGYIEKELLSTYAQVMENCNEAYESLCKIHRNIQQLKTYMDAAHIDAVGDISYTHVTNVLNSMQGVNVSAFEKDRRELQFDIDLPDTEDSTIYLQRLSGIVLEMIETLQFSVKDQYTLLHGFKAFFNSEA